MREAVSSVRGEEYIVVGVPTGTPVRAEFAPDTTSIVGNIVWNVYLACRGRFARQWKVAVLRKPSWRFASESVVTREVLPRGVTPDTRLRELVEACRRGSFDLGTTAPDLAP